MSWFTLMFPLWALWRLIFLVNGYQHEGDYWNGGGHLHHEGDYWNDGGYAIRGAFISYTTLTFMSCGRQAEVLLTFSDAAVILGAKQKQVHRDRPLQVCQLHKGWILVSAGYSQHGNKHAGVCIAHNTQWILMKQSLGIGYVFEAALQCKHVYSFV